MYTEIYVNVDLKEDTPSEVIDVLKAMCGEEGGKALKGFPNRWMCLFSDMSYYTPRTSCRNLTFDKIGNNWSLLGKGDIKNYEGEIEQFFEWIKPYVEGNSGDFIGYMRYEEDQLPTLVTLN